MTPEEARLFGEKLLRDVVALPEQRMKLAVLAERLGELVDEDLVETFEWMIRKIALAPTTYPGVIMSLIEGEAFARRIGYRRVAAIYRLAIEAGYADTARLFLRGAPRKPVGELKPEVRFPEMEGKTLGERKNLARRGRWQAVSQLLYDTNSEVVRNLLLNPRIRETEVVKIAARRPNSPEILRMIAENPRWSSRVSVRKALVFNPHLPINLALALVTSLNKEDLLATAEDGLLHPWLRERARRILQERQPRKKATANPASAGDTAEGAAEPRTVLQGGATEAPGLPAPESETETKS